MFSEGGLSLGVPNPPILRIRQGTCIKSSREGCWPGYVAANPSHCKPHTLTLTTHTRSLILMHTLAQLWFARPVSSLTV